MILNAYWLHEWNLQTNKMIIHKKTTDKDERITQEIVIAIRETNLCFEDKLLFPWIFTETFNEMIKDMENE